MKLFTLFFSAALILPAAALSQPDHSHRLLIRFTPQALPHPSSLTLSDDLFGIDKLDRLNQKHGISSVSKAFPYIPKKASPSIRNRLKRTFILQFTSPLTEEMIRAYSTIDILELAERSFSAEICSRPVPVTPNDPFYQYQWAWNNNGSFSKKGIEAREDADIDMDSAWFVERGDTSVIVAILDTGIEPDHPDIDDRLWRNPGEVPGNGTDDDGNGLIDDVYGWDFANTDSAPVDSHGHGTHIAGIIGAEANNSIGHCGIDWHCRLMICQTFASSGLNRYEWNAAAIYYAVDNGADILNMSFGGDSISQIIREAIEYAYDNNVTMITPMGNLNHQTTHYPAGYPQTIAVGSSDWNDRRSHPFFDGLSDPSSGSNYGEHIDVTAPGNYLYGLDALDVNNYGKYFSGTSQATAVVSGIAALLLAQDSTRTPEQIRFLLRETAEDQVGDPLQDTPGFDIYHGYGRVNAYEALKRGKEPVSTVKYSRSIKRQIPVKNATAYDLLGRRVAVKRKTGKNVPAGVYLLREKHLVRKKAVMK